MKYAWQAKLKANSRSARLGQEFYRWGTLIWIATSAFKGLLPAFNGCAPGKDLQQKLTHTLYMDSKGLRLLLVTLKSHQIYVGTLPTHQRSTLDQLMNGITRAPARPSTATKCWGYTAHAKERSSSPSSARRLRKGIHVAHARPMNLDC